MSNWQVAAAQAAQVSPSFSKRINGGLLNPSVNTITLTGSAGNALGSNTSPWHNIVLGEESGQSHVKKYEVYEIAEDILLLSVVWQRLRKEREQNNIPTNVSSIVDKHLFDSITHEDRERTEKIRDYYSKKFVMWALNEVRLSNFREDLKKLIQSDGKIFQENIKPLAYRLPEFYDYDISFDEMFVAHNPKIKASDRVNRKTISLVKTCMHRRRHHSYKEFWFKDENDNLSLITVNKDNPLMSLMDHFSKNTFTIVGNFTKKIRDNREYFVIEKYSFL